MTNFAVALVTWGTLIGVTVRYGPKLARLITNAVIFFSIGVCVSLIITQIQRDHRARTALADFDYRA